MEKEQLKIKLAEANKAYRTGSAIMSDTEYDNMLDVLRSIEEPADFTAFVNTLHETAGKVRIEFVMGSLDKLKVQEPDTILDFISKHVPGRLNVSAKVDGLSCRIRYKNGTYVSANSRGDGYFGEDWTEKVRLIKNFKQKIDFAGDMDIRGELVILKSDFITMEEEKNPRNVCAGIMNRKPSSKEWSESDFSLVSFVPYAILDKTHTKAEQFKILCDLGFTPAWNMSFDRNYFSENGLDIISELTKYATQDLPYAIDGVVISDDNYVNEEKYRPDAQAAVKTNTLEADSVLVDVAWEGPTKNGAIIPVAVIEPVELGESVISRATLHNLDFIAEKGLKYGCGVRICKSGDIIPAIVRMTHMPDGAEEIEYPTVCPCCGSQLIRYGVNLRCMNKSCIDQNVYKVMHFIKNLGVMGASFKTLKGFGISSYDKLIEFKPNPNRKSEMKLYAEVKEKIFSRAEEDIFCSLNIEGLGETLQRKIVDHYGWDNIKTGSVNFETAPMPFGIGQAMLECFKLSYSDNVNIVLKFSADSRYNCMKSNDRTEKRVKKGSLCFTGALTSIGRKQAAEMAERAGYEVKSSVGKGLTFLVTNDAGSGSTKAEKAKKLGTRVINEKEFLEMVNSDKVETNINDF